jgi:hypothetical protein
MHVDIREWYYGPSRENIGVRNIAGICSAFGQDDDVEVLCADNKIFRVNKTLFTTHCGLYNKFTQDVTNAEQNSFPMTDYPKRIVVMAFTIATLETVAEPYLNDFAEEFVDVWRCIDQYEFQLHRVAYNAKEQYPIRRLGANPIFGFAYLDGRDVIMNWEQNNINALMLGFLWYGFLGVWPYNGRKDYTRVIHILQKLTKVYGIPAFYGLHIGPIHVLEQHDRDTFFQKCSIDVFRAMVENTISLKPLGFMEHHRDATENATLAPDALWPQCLHASPQDVLNMIELYCGTNGNAVYKEELKGVFDSVFQFNVDAQTFVRKA